MGKKFTFSPDDVYAHIIVHPEAHEQGDRDNYGKDDLIQVSKRLPSTPLHDGHDGSQDLGRVLGSWVGKDGLNTINEVSGTSLRHEIAKRNLITGIYNGSSLSSRILYSGKGGRTGNGLSRPIGNPIDIGLMPLEGSGRGDDCRVLCVATGRDMETYLRKHGKDRNVIDTTDESHTETGKKTNLLKAVRLIKEREAEAIELGLDGFKQQTKEDTNMAEVSQTPKEVVAQPPPPQKQESAVVTPSIPKQPEQMAAATTPTTPTPAPVAAAPAAVAPAQVSPLSRVIAENQGMDPTTLLAKMSQALASAHQQIEQYKQQISANPTEAEKRELSAKERVAQMLNNDREVFEKSMKQALGAFGKRVPPANMTKLYADVSAYGCAKDEAEKSALAQKISENIDTVEMIQACASVTMDETRRAQDLLRQKDAAELAKQELQSKYDSLITHTVTQAASVLKSFNDLENAGNLTGRIERKREAPSLPIGAADITSRILAPDQDIAPPPAKQVRTESSVQITKPQTPVNAISMDPLLNWAFEGMLPVPQ
jgi:hypothetical protein